MSRFPHNTHLSPFEEFSYFLEHNIEKDYKQFLSQWNNEYSSSRIKNFDEVKHSFEILKDTYGEGESETVLHSFESFISHKLTALVDTCIKIINEGYTRSYFSKKTSNDYINRINTKFMEIYDIPNIKRFSFLPKYLGIVEKHLESFPELVKAHANSDIILNDPFAIQPGYSRKFLSDVFDICISHSLIDIEFEKGDFWDIFTDPRSTKTVKFQCPNNLVITFFESIKPAFNNLTAKAIHSSSRFLTKQGKVLSETNYNSTKNRSQPDAKILDLKQALFDLID